PLELSHRINVEGISILVVEADFVFDEVFQESGSLKLLGSCRNGLDHIDVEAATDHGVAVVNTPGRNSQGVAELTISLMLSLARGIPRLSCYVKGGLWQDPTEPYISMRGVELHGRTLGIIGLGSIGRKVARLGKAFGMHTVAYDPYVGTPGSKKAGAMLNTLEEVLESSDFLSIHTAGTSETERMLDRRRLGMMKTGSYVINTAAYHVIEEEALVEYLKSGHIAGAALDVHRTHPIQPSSLLLGLDNVILTPHIGGATDGTVEKQSWIIVDEIHRFLRGRRPRHLVNGEVWRKVRVRHG
ncbi:MAG: phosphoglycerate dehydrogenase, partial [Dehalococcoidia bacterium]|nr:phosphoglycerate dehydrogenase [Dehalococcoidia bacterium]